MIAEHWRTETFNASDGTQLSVWRHANTDASLPHLHFAHATGLNGYAYRRLLEPLAEQANIWAWDMRGHGLSNPAEKIKSWRTYYDDLACLIRHIDQPVVLAGHSVGGMSSGAAAAANPDQVRGLLMLDPVVIHGRMAWMGRLGKLLGQMHQQPLAKAALRRRRRFESPEQALATYRGRSIFKAWPDAWIEDYIEVGFTDSANGIELACTPEFESNSFAAAEVWPFKRFAGLRCPTIVLAAEQQSTMSPTARDKFRKQFAFADVRQVEGGSHMLPFQFPEQIRSELVELLDE